MNIFDLHAKVKRVISGCSSMQQLDVADRYNDLFTKKVREIYPDPYASIYIMRQHPTAEAMISDCSNLLRVQRYRLGC